MKTRCLGFLVAVLMTTGCRLSSADFLPTWNAGYRGDIPELPVVIEIDASAIRTQGHVAIQAAIDNASAPGAVLLPPGVFELHGPIALRSGIVLRGASPGTTHLKFHPLPAETFAGPVRPAFGAIRFEGTKHPKEYTLRAGFERGSDQLSLDDLTGLSAGQMVLIFSENDPELLYTDPRWDRDWALQSLAQIVEIVAVQDGSITLDTPLRLAYQAELDPRLLIIDPIEQAGVEDLTVENLDPESHNIIGLENAQNCWVRRCESINTARGHIWVNFSRFITIAENEVHHSFSYGGGGAGYGIVAGNIATDCLITDNILHQLRHALMVKRGANGNVFSYNYSFERRREPEGSRLLCDISLHGHYPYQNLFEGNVVEFIELADYWGPTGPRTTFLRNHVQTSISLLDHSHQAIFLGNRITESGFTTDGTSQDLILGGNTLSGGKTLPSIINVETIPDSAYRTSPPENWGGLPWPVLADPTADGTLIPAQRRWQETPPDDD